MKAKQNGFVVESENGMLFFSMEETDRDLEIHQLEGKWYNGKERLYKFN